MSENSTTTAGAGAAKNAVETAPASTTGNATAGNAAAGASRPPLIALIGNPNTGKTSLFNALTGLRQRIGNYPGVTVAKHSGTVVFDDGRRAELLDLPGLYSLAATSLDERIVIDALCGRLPDTPAPDAVLVVTDGTNLLRNLFLASQVAELGIPLAIVVNHADAVRKFRIRVDAAKLGERLGGVPVVLASAWHGEGIHEIRAALRTVLDHRPRMSRVAWKPCVTDALQILRDGLARDAQNNAAGADTAAAAAAGAALPSDAELQRLLFDTATPVLDRLTAGDAARRERIAHLVRAARERVRHGGLNPFAAEPVLHYERIKEALAGAVTDREAVAQSRTRRIDKVLLHRVWGTLIFFGAMAAVFLAVFFLAEYPKGWLETLFAWLSDTAGGALESAPLLQSLVQDGVIAGVGAFLSFLPQIMLLFLFIALLEDSGYMARAAFLMDKLFSWCGLNGKSFVPLLSGYACAIPSIMATRTIEDPKARAATIFAVPFMSCSARLPVYSLMLAAFLTPQLGPATAGALLVAMYLAGLAVAVPTAWVLTRFILKTRAQPFVLEMPRYQVPKPRDVLWRVWQSAAEFVKRAGTIIFAITVLVWALLYFPHDDAVEERVKTEFAAKAKETAAPAAAGGAGAEKPAAGDAKAATDAAAGGGDEKSEADAALERAIEQAHVENSYLGRFGKWAQPLFAPCGFDWKITVGILASFPAREVIVSTLGITYSLGGEVDEESEDLKTALAKSRWSDTAGALAGKPIYTLPVVLALMLFFALCSQCGATLATIRQEAGWRWAAASFFFMTVLAWLAAAACNQLGSRLLAAL
jgi:ferrous iron transport protein B